MGKNNTKFTQDHVEEYFRSKGCILIDAYKNSTTPLNYICKCGNPRKTTFSKFKSQKHGCRICTGLEKYSQEFVQQYFLDRNCKLLTEYLGAQEPLEYICECGEPCKSTFDSFKNRDTRCIKCGIKKNADKQRFDIEYVRQIFTEGGCTPLFDEYHGVHEVLDYICECGNESKISLSDFQYGKRCNNCRVERIHKTMYKNGTQQCSTQQRYVFNLIGGVGGELNYPIGTSTLDIAFPSELIYVEYDGSGHDLSVKLNSMSVEEFKKKETRRRYALYRRGWREIRIVSKQDRLPEKEVIFIMLNKAKELIKNGTSSFVVFDIDNETISYKDVISYFDFGRSSRIKSSDIR